MIRRSADQQPRLAYLQLQPARYPQGQGDGLSDHPLLLAVLCLLGRGEEQLVDPPVEDEGPGGPLGNLGENRGYYQEISDVSRRSGDAGPVCP